MELRGKACCSTFSFIILPLLMAEQQNFLLQSIYNDVRLIGEMMKEFSRHVISNDVSKYPVYAASKSEMSLGKPFLTMPRHGLNWNYNASVLEEFVKKEIVKMDKLEEFREAFGDPEERACIFVIAPDEMGFIFVPYEPEVEHK